MLVVGSDAELDLLLVGLMDSEKVEKTVEKLVI